MKSVLGKVREWLSLQPNASREELLKSLQKLPDAEQRMRELQERGRIIFLP